MEDQAHMEYLSIQDRMRHPVASFLSQDVQGHHVRHTSNRQVLCRPKVATRQCNHVLDTVPNEVSRRWNLLLSKSK